MNFHNNLCGAFLVLGCTAASAGSLDAPRADVAIDVGHSVSRPGSTSANGRPEFEFNSRLALAIEKATTSRGLKVRMVNRDGSIDALSRRVEEAGATSLFVSIHHDSVQPQFLPVTNPRFSGYSVWVSRQNQRSDESVACATSVGVSLRQAGFVPSNYHSDPIPGENHPVLDAAAGVFANDRLYVLRSARSAAILIEAGVIVNASEEASLIRDDVVRRKAEAIALGLEECVRTISAKHPRAQ